LYPITASGASDPNYTVTFVAGILTITSAAPAKQISGRVFLDYNADGVQQSNEPGLAGRSVFLDANNNGVLDPDEPSTPTGTGGLYSFTGLAAGTYAVRDNFPLNHGIAHTAPPGGQSVTLTSEANSAALDVGLVFVSTVVPVQVTPTIYPDHAADADTSFVQGLYHSLLGRGAESAALQVWVHWLHAGASRQAVAGAIWDSPEHRGILLDNYYATFLNRKADAGGKAAWLGAFQAGATANDVVLGFLTSPEYQMKYVSDEAFVKRLYFDVLGRNAEPEGLAAWEQVLRNGGTRKDVARRFIDSSEEYRQTVDGFYAALLHRGGDAPGEQDWLHQLQAGVARKSIAVGFLAAEEYFANAQSHVG
jgi:hypothetical protein